MKALSRGQYNVRANQPRGRLGDKTVCFVGTHQKREGHRNYGPGSKFFTFYGLKLSVESQLLGFARARAIVRVKRKGLGTTSWR